MQSTLAQLSGGAAATPLQSTLLLGRCKRGLRRLSVDPSLRNWPPFARAVGLFVPAFIGLAHGLFPCMAVDRITDAASATESLRIMFIGVAISLPAIIACMVYSYRVFSGKSADSRY